MTNDPAQKKPEPHPEGLCEVVGDTDKPTRKVTVTWRKQRIHVAVGGSGAFVRPDHARALASALSAAADAAEKPKAP